MTPAEWIICAVLGALLCAFCAGWILGGRQTYRQLERDTSGWRHDPRGIGTARLDRRS